MVSNSARPEGNVTGFSRSFESLGGKWLELLKEIAPNITRVAYLWRGVAPYRSVETAAQLLAVQANPIMVSDVDTLKAAVEGFAARPNGGLIFSPGQIAFEPPELIRLAAQYPPSLSIASWALWISQHGADGIPICAHLGSRQSRGGALRQFIADDTRSRQQRSFHSRHFSLTPNLTS
jgi:hypothetical protein